MRVALDYAGDPLPAEEPQAEEARAQEKPIEHDWNPTKDYKLVWANGQLDVSPDLEHDELAGRRGVQPNHTGPMAIGYIHVDMGKATFEIESNINAKVLVRIFKDFCDQQHWRWGGLTDIQGEPVGTGSEFAPVKTHYFGWSEERNHLYLSKIAKLSGGVIHVDGNIADVRPLRLQYFEAVKEWADDNGLQLVSGNDNVIKRIEDLEQDNIYDPNWENEDDHFGETSPSDDRQPGGVFKCPDCSQIFPNWGQYIVHRRGEEPDSVEQHGGFPEMDMDATFPPHFHEQPKFFESAQQPKDMIPAPVPFIYDIKDDTISIGHPGSQAADIPGRFTPGGIVQGTYEPGGKIALQTATNMPYTVRHMLELWYAQQPSLQVTTVHLIDPDGKSTKLA